MAPTADGSAASAMAPKSNVDLRRRAWRLHFLAALLVIPFVLWQSLTGTLYLWSEAWVDHRHPDLRFVTPATSRASMDVQVDAARAFFAGTPVDSVLVPGDATRSTQVMFTDRHGLPVAAFVDPYRGVLLGSLEGSAWPVGWSRSLHGGWPLGDAGSWLLEIGACWTLVMVATGLYLWWPRDGRGWRALLPRLRAGRWTFWRDLHACVAVWFSLLIVGFLLTALPWTHFWGGSILGPVQERLGQAAPAAAGFAPVFEGHGSPASASLQQMVDQARARGLQGDLMLRMVDGPPGSAVSVRNVAPRASQERYLLLDRGDAAVLQQADGAQLPMIARTVATGVKLHEGDYFGRLGPWINTAFAAALVWLSLSGLLAWWTRKPSQAVGVPPRGRRPWPMWLRVVAVGSFVVLPLLAVSALALWIVERVWARVDGAREATA